MAVQELDFRPFVEVSGVYDTGLAGVTVTQQGQLATSASVGVQINAGVSGLHSWQHTKIGLNYNVSLIDYTRKTYYDYVNQNLLLSLTHQFSRHVILAIDLTGSEFSQNFSQLGLPQTVAFDPSTAQVPTTDFFDNRTYFVNANLRLIYQRTARLSFSFGGDGSLVRRRSGALYGSNGAAANGDVQYRLSRTTTLGANYTYSQYTFTGGIGGTDLHSVSGTFGWRIGRWLEASGYVGVTRMENKFLEVVQLDPVIQALFGFQNGVAISYQVTYVPNVSVRISRTFPRGVLYLNGGRSVLPGNGLFLTSVTTQAGGGYGYTGLRRWSLGASVNYWRATATGGNLIGRYDTLSGGITASRQISGSFHFVASANGRRYSSGTFSAYNRPFYDVRIGLGWSPGNIPLRVW